MKVKDVRTGPDWLALDLDRGRQRLDVVDERIIRVRYTVNDTFAGQGSPVVVPQAPRPVEWSCADDVETVCLVTPFLQLEIRKDSGAFTWRDAAGELLVREPAQGGKTLGPADILSGAAGVSVSAGGISSAAGGILSGAGGILSAAFSTRLEFEFAPGEAIYGLGQHEEGILNYRGHSQVLYQTNNKVALPVLVSTRGWGILFDTCALSSFHDDVHGSYFWTETAEEMDFYFLYGPEFDGIVRGIRRLTGPAPLRPRWAFGYIQSKDRYKRQSELVETVAEFRRRGIPIDAIALDRQSWPGSQWGQKSLDPDRFPDPDKMMADLHRLHARLLVSVWPRFAGDGPDQSAMREQGFLLGDDQTYNAFLPEARALYWQQADQGLFRHGIDGWCCNGTEPFEPDRRGPLKPEPWQRLVANTGVAKAYLGPLHINAYSLLHAQGMYEGQRAVTGEKRVVNLTRSASPGQQRYGTVTWSGDVSAGWPALRKQIAEGLNFTVTGCPGWTCDIGGTFTRKLDDLWYRNGEYPDGCESAAYRELYVRWFQAGAFLPMFRAHGTDTPREVWRFGRPGERAYEALVKAIRLRYRLLPYIYSLAGWETHRDYTMLRSLAFDFRHDPLVHNIADQFMLGPALLVCPVTEPLYASAEFDLLPGKTETRKVYLPEGCAWYNFWTGRRYAGGQTLTTPAPLESLPLFVRAGSILPFGPEIQYAGEKPAGPVTLRVYPGADGRFDLYDDEGDSYRYEQGEYTWTTFTWDDRAQHLDVGQPQGQYRGMVEKTYRVVVVQEGQGIGLE